MKLGQYDSQVSTSGDMGSLWWLATLHIVYLASSLSKPVLNTVFLLYQVLLLCNFVLARLSSVLHLLVSSTLLKLFLPSIFHSDVFPFKDSLAQQEVLSYVKRQVWCEAHLSPEQWLCRALYSDPMLWRQICIICLHTTFCEWKHSCTTSARAMIHLSDFSSLWKYT